MNPLSFDQAKQQIAERHGSRDWSHLMTYNMKRTSEQNIKESAELLANECVKADRELVLEKVSYPSQTYAKIFKTEIRSLPLPFPEKP